MRPSKKIIPPNKITALLLVGLLSRSQGRRPVRIHLNYLHIMNQSRKEKLGEAKIDRYKRLAAPIFESSSEDEEIETKMVLKPQKNMQPCVTRHNKSKIYRGSSTEELLSKLQLHIKCKSDKHIRYVISI